MNARENSERPSIGASCACIAMGAPVAFLRAALSVTWSQWPWVLMMRVILAFRSLAALRRGCALPGAGSTAHASPPSQTRYALVGSGREGMASISSAMASPCPPGLNALRAPKSLVRAVDDCLHCVRYGRARHAFAFPDVERGGDVVHRGEVLAPGAVEEEPPLVPFGEGAVEDAELLRPVEIADVDLPLGRVCA